MPPRRSPTIPALAAVAVSALGAACGPATTREAPNIAPPTEDKTVGLTASCEQQRCGYVDTTGALIIPRRFKRAMPFYEGLASVLVEGAGWGVIDRTGRLVVGPNYASIGPFSEGVAAAQPSAKYLYRWVYIDHAGRAAISLAGHVEFAFPFHGGKAWITVPYLFASRAEEIDRRGQVIRVAPAR